MITLRTFQIRFMPPKHRTQHRCCLNSFNLVSGLNNYHSNNMKHLRLILGVFALMLACVTAQAKKGDTFTIGNLKYTVLSENATAKTGTASVAPAKSTLSGDLIIPATITQNDITYTVTTIKSFYSYSITTIEIPATVTSIAAGDIGSKTLYGIVVDEGNTKFAAIDNVLYDKNITQLICYPAQKEDEEFHAPETLTKINTYAFRYSIVNKVFLNEGLTSIANQAFVDCSNLEWVDIPSTLTDLGSFAFQRVGGYDKCFNVNIHDLAAFCNVTCANNQASIWMDDRHKESNLYIDGQKITDLVIPSEVSIVKSYVFQGCKGLKSVTFMGDLQFVDTGAFADCKIEKIQFNGTCGYIGTYAFRNNNLKEDVVLPEGVTLIGSQAFEYDDDPFNIIFNGIDAPLTDLVRINVYLPSTLQTIGTYAFAHLPINELHIAGDGLKTINAGAFRCYGGTLGKCKSLWIDNLENWLKVDMKYESYSYSDGRFITYNNAYFWNIPATYFALGSFPMGGQENQRGRWNNTDLAGWSKDVAIPRIAQFSDLYLNGQLVTDLVIPEGTKRIKRGAFAGCQSIKTVTLPNSLDTIGEYAFYQCPNIRVIKIPNSVKHIGISAFDENWAMTHVTMPSWATAIGLNVVKNFNTDKLTEFTIPAYVEDFFGAKDLYYTPFTDMSLYFMGDSIPNKFKDPERKYRYKNMTTGVIDTLNLVWSDTTYLGNYQVGGWYNGQYRFNSIWGGYPHYDMQKLYVKKSVYNNRYPDGLWRGHAVSYKVPVSMTNSSGNPIEYKTLCRDFDVDLTHTNDNLPEGVEPLRAYLVEDVEGDLRMVFLNEIKYIPSRLKANVTDENGNLYQGVDEYVGVVLRGTPGYTYYYEIGEHDYTQGAEGQWLMEDAMAYSNATFENNLMAGDANDDFYVHMSVEDENNDEIINYGLNSGKFKIYYKDGWLTYNKSYLQLPKHVSDAIESDTDADGNANLTFVFNNADGTTDKVSSVEFNRNCESDIFYNPYGQRVNANTKGIVINNGRKFINK